MFFSQLHYVYILQCADGSHYTGCTNDLIKRLKEHEQGKIHYTKTRLPVELITFIVFKDKFKAFKFEKYLKSGSGKAFMKKRFAFTI